MSESVTQLKLYDLPKEINVSDLISVFKNKEKNGGGPIQELLIHYSSEECYAIITFEETDAVSRILKRGKKVPILDFHVEVDIFNDKKCCCRESQNLKDQPGFNSRSIEEQNSEKILHEASFISLPEKMPEDFLIFEDTGNEIWNRTIKAHICERKKSKKHYELFFEDIGLNSYDPDSMMLDGLHKFVYVTFKDIKEAQKLCQLPLDTEDYNISKVEMAKQKDFETYEDRLFLYSYDGLSLKDLPGFVEDKTGLDIKEVFQEDEKCAAIIVFDETDITPLTWDLTNLNGTRMITAPVYKEKSVLVAGLNSDVSKTELNRYLKSKKYSGGGPVESVDLIDECQALVTFVDERDLEKFLEKDNHELEGCLLEVSRIYSCLTKSYIQKFVDPVTDKKLMKLSEKDHKVHEIDSSIKKVIQKSTEICLPQRSDSKITAILPDKKNDNKNIDLSSQKKTEKKISLLVGEFNLLNNCSFFKKIKKMCIQSEIGFEIENQTIILKGLKSSVRNLKFEILKKCKSDIKSIKLEDLTQEQTQVLMIENIRERLNSLLHGGYLELSNNEFILSYLKSEALDSLMDFLKTQIYVEAKQLRLENVNSLKSTKGQTFLERFNDSFDFKSMGKFVLLDEVGLKLLIMAPEKEIAEVVRLVDEFLLQNKFLTKSMKFPEGKQKFINKYLQQEIAQLNKDNEIHIKASDNIVTVSGITENVIKCKKKLQQLRDNILEDRLTLTFYGIKECLEETSNQDMLHSIAVKNKCIVIINKDTSSSLSDIEDIDVDKADASAMTREKYFHSKINVGKLEVTLKEGEITNEQTDVIVTTVDKSLDLTKGRMSRTVLEKAGARIQQELNSKFRFGISPMDLAQTAGGDLTCSHILFVCLSRIRDPDRDPDKLSENKSYLRLMQSLVDKILREAHRLNAATISIPALGTGQLGYSADITAQATINAIKDFDSFYSSSNLKCIQLVVYPSDKDVLKVFRRIILPEDKSSSNFDSVGKSDIGQKEQSKRMTFGNVQLVIKQGDITMESGCETIVNSIKDNMDLSKSGKVCQTLLAVCGSCLQELCNRKKFIMFKDGLVVTDAPNLKCKKIIHISQDRFMKDWSTGISKVLNEADRFGAKSLALPALGAGSRHANVKEIKKTILEAIQKFSRDRERKLTLIKLVIFDKKILDSFLENEQESPQDAILSQAELSKEALIKIYSDRDQNIKETKQEIEMLLEESYVDTTLDNLNGLHLVSKENIDELKKFGIQNKIQVVIHEDGKQLKLYGFNKSGVDPLVSKLNNFLAIAFDNMKVTKTKIKAPETVWQFKRQENWSNFEPLVSHQLEQEFNKGRHFCPIRDSFGETYVVDFIQRKQHFLNHEGITICSFETRRTVV
ncbi:poly [ADP-ribose] polymerase 14 [Biomphalaria pfeifferi]|uniref:Poly [ADP-ribose] polymerase 14 n=1 Tax=Biomphalaria pfeifferi TaxID=112525 RepID=A0AAD8BK69_BIOPF|nr:poly [ADP-ribose] polymerase 14 [Biomphalaria pfeifferi]